jgi:hypothetical protein
MVGQGLLPGRTLSSSDGLWSVVPWTTSKPSDVRQFGANFELADAIAVFQPFFEFTRSVLPDVPLWNPHVMGGRPYLANAQSAVFSPFTLPALLLPLWKSLAVMAALKLFVGAFGMYLLGRTLGMRFGGALLAGVVFAFGTFFVVWLAWPLTNIFPLIPFLLLLTELVVRRPGPLPVAGLAALVALQFLGGHPETSFHVMYATVLWFVLRAGIAWSREGRRRDAVVRSLVAFSAALALGTGLAALALVPLLELLFESADWERRLDSQPSFAPREYFGTLFLHDYWGRPTQTAEVPFVSNRGYYAGAITLMLAAAALVLRPTLTRVALLAFSVVTLNVVLGISPIADVFFELPFFSTAHNGRMVILVLVCLALLAGWGLDELSAKELPGRSRRKLALAVVSGIFVLPVVWMLLAGTIEPSKLGPALKVAWGFEDPPLSTVAGAAKSAAAPVVRLSALLQWLPLAGAGLVLVALRLRLLRGRRWALPAGAFVALAVGLLAVDLFRANMGFNPAIPIDNARQPTTGAIRYLQARVPNRFSGIGPIDNTQVLSPDLAMRYDLFDARGYDYPVERRYDSLWRGTAGPVPDFVPSTTRAQETEESLRTLSLLSVSDVMQDPAGKRLSLPGLSVAYDGPDARVYRNANALPRAFLVERQRSVQGRAAARAAVTSPLFDPRRVAVTERPVAGIPSERSGASASASAGSARLVSYGREQALIAAKARRRSLLVFTDAHYPGWKARVDGRPAKIERVNYMLRGVSLPAGSHRIEFSYEPASWRVGWVVSLLSLLVLGALAFAGLRRRRSPRAVRT